jgi:hypothetical protein
VRPMARFVILEKGFHRAMPPDCFCDLFGTIARGNGLRTYQNR